MAQVAEKPLETHREIPVALLTSTAGIAGDAIPGQQGTISPASLQGQPVHSRDRTDNTSVGFHMFSGLEKAFMAWHSTRATLCTLRPVSLNFCCCEDRTRQELQRLLSLFHGKQNLLPPVSGRKGDSTITITHKLLGKMGFHWGMV